MKSSPVGAGYSVENLVGKNGQLRAAIYLRVSTGDQNCDRQEADLIAYADRCGYQVRKIFRETGSGLKVDRIERGRIMALARSRQIDIILVTELTRWGRSTIDLLDSLGQLQSWGISLIAQNGFQFDLSTPHGKMIASIMATLAEFERDLLRERIRSGIANARLKGKIFGRPKGGKISKCCDRINQLRKQGMTVRAIALEVGMSKSAIAQCPRCPSLSEGLNF